MRKKAELRKQLSNAGVDAILVTDPVNVRYLSGFTGSSGYLIISQKHAVLGTDFRYQEQVKHEVSGFSVVIEDSERTGEIRDICKERGIKKLGFEARHVTYDLHKRLINKKIKLAPLDKTVEDLRIIKTDEELKYIKIAVKRAETAFRKLLPHIKAGAEELKLAVMLEDFIRKEGCKTLPFAVILASGSMSALPHARPGNKTLKKGDLVVIDWGGECEGYFSDMTRTLLIKGRNMDRQKEIYYTVLEAQKRALNTVKAGATTAEVDAAARDFIEAKGHGDFFGHGTGHGVGLAVHEEPGLSWRSKEKIMEDMVFTIEPGIYRPEIGGVRIEDMVVCRKGKAELLTTLPKNLKIIER